MFKEMRQKNRQLSNDDEKLIALEEFINKYSSEYKESEMKYIQAAEEWLFYCKENYLF